MAITVTFSSAFQDLAGGRESFTVRGDRLPEILADLGNQIPGLKDKLFKREGKIHPAYHVILLRGKSQELCQDLDCHIADGDEVVIALVITGG